jgi:hypothetical protein
MSPKARLRPRELRRLATRDLLTMPRVFASCPDWLMTVSSLHVTCLWRVLQLLQPEPTAVRLLSRPLRPLPPIADITANTLKTGQCHRTGPSALQQRSRHRRVRSIERQKLQSCYVARFTVFTARASLTLRVLSGTCFCEVLAIFSRECYSTEAALKTRCAEVLVRANGQPGCCRQACF